MTDDPVKNSVKGAIEAIYKPIESIVKTLAGPAAEEIGLSLKDSVQAWRLKRQIRLFERVKQICKETGIKPQAVKMPLLFEIIEKGSLEEEDDLQDIWANMLANAADPKRASLVTTAYPEILKQLCITEVRFLVRIIETNPKVRLEDISKIEMPSGAAYPFTIFWPPKEKIKNTKPERIAEVHCDNLKRLGLIDIEKPLEETSFQEVEPTTRPLGMMGFTRLKAGTCVLTTLGFSFIVACSIPKSKKPRIN